ncbi:hypothetical protein PoB_000499500 [Plakobranchus ocellatus]|uniref:Uncharacterized protein n=1 Tax=Plakobranchus ocellatus TaxID=259542 RepID=A0AAV3Y7N3_9GAST|nr:hypothetical protein PoB_000499500 [Plakobranchus ocellatus]
MQRNQSKRRGHRRRRSRLNADLFLSDSDDEERQRPHILSPSSRWKQLQYQTYLRERLRNGIRSQNSIWVDTMGRPVTLAERILRFRITQQHMNQEQQGEEGHQEQPGQQGQRGQRVQMMRKDSEEINQEETHAERNVKSPKSLRNLLAQYTRQREKEARLSSALLEEISNAKQRIEMEHLSQHRSESQGISLGDSATNVNAKTRNSSCLASPNSMRKPLFDQADIVSSAATPTIVDVSCHRIQHHGDSCKSDTVSRESEKQRLQDNSKSSETVERKASQFLLPDKIYPGSIRYGVLSARYKNPESESYGFNQTRESTQTLPMNGEEDTMKNKYCKDANDRSNQNESKTTVTDSSKSLADDRIKPDRHEEALLSEKSVKTRTIKNQEENNETQDTSEITEEKMVPKNKKCPTHENEVEVYALSMRNVFKEFPSSAYEIHTSNTSSSKNNISDDTAYLTESSSDSKKKLATDIISQRSKNVTDSFLTKDDFTSSEQPLEAFPLSPLSEQDHSIYYFIDHCLKRCYTEPELLQLSCYGPDWKRPRSCRKLPGRIVFPEVAGDINDNFVSPKTIDKGLAKIYVPEVKSKFAQPTVGVLPDINITNGITRGIANAEPANQPSRNLGDSGSKVLDGKDPKTNTYVKQTSFTNQDRSADDISHTELATLMQAKKRVMGLRHELTSANTSHKRPQAVTITLLLHGPSRCDMRIDWGLSLENIRKMQVDYTCFQNKVARSNKSCAGSRPNKDLETESPQETADLKTLEKTRSNWCLPKPTTTPDFVVAGSLQCRKGAPCGFSNTGMRNALRKPAEFLYLREMTISHFVAKELKKDEVRLYLQPLTEDKYESKTPGKIASLRPRIWKKSRIFVQQDKVSVVSPRHYRSAGITHPNITVKMINNEKDSSGNICIGHDIL